jgi:hypothetical protein
MRSHNLDTAQICLTHGTTIDASGRISSLPYYSPPWMGRTSRMENAKCVTGFTLSVFRPSPFWWNHSGGRSGRWHGAFFLGRLANYQLQGRRDARWPLLPHTAALPSTKQKNRCGDGIYLALRRGRRLQTHIQAETHHLGRTGQPYPLQPWSCK